VGLCSSSVIAFVKVWLSMGWCNSIIRLGSYVGCEGLEQARKSGICGLYVLFGVVCCIWSWW